MLTREDIITWNILSKVLDVYFDATPEVVIEKTKALRDSLFEKTKEDEYIPF